MKPQVKRFRCITLDKIYNIKSTISTQVVPVVMVDKKLASTALSEGSRPLEIPLQKVSHKGGHPNQQGHLLWLAESQTSRYASVYYGTGFRSGKELGHRPTELCLGTTESAKCEMSPKCVTFSTAGNEKPGQPSGPAQCSNK
uniref:Uncharacterized protein n=1 Tax=Anopheles coluzzii TaxID=1518534 RepID=A0A8W7Q1R1_ANOCL